VTKCFDGPLSLGEKEKGGAVHVSVDETALRDVAEEERGEGLGLDLCGISSFPDILSEEGKKK